MGSVAYLEWSLTRKSRIDQLLDAHTQMGGVGRGRRWRTEQVNWALVLRIAAEFQGFCRDLHDEAAAVVAERAAVDNPALQQVLVDLLKSNRQIDRGNATPGALGADFGRFGLDLWPNLRSRAVMSEGRQQRLTELIAARNAISHGDTQRLAGLRAGNRALDLTSVRNWLSSLGALARTMDAAVADRIVYLVGGRRPW